MAKTKISALTTLADGSIAIGDLIPIVDVSDTSQAASGTTKKVTITSLASAVATAFSGDSPTFVNLTTTGTTTLGDSGDATTVNGTLGVTGVATFSDNIAMASGKGIDFSATAGTGSSEILSDYEEGTWTPSVGGSATYNAANNGSYTKVGNVVHCQFRLHITLIGTGSTSVISGLPFTSSASFFEQAGCVGLFEALATNMTFLTVYAPASATTLTLNGLAVAAASTTSPAAVIGTNTVIFGSISYKV